MTDEQAGQGPGGETRPDADETFTLTPDGRPERMPTTARRVALASVVVTALCAGGVALFGGAAPAHHTKVVSADPTATPPYTADLGTPPPWPAADPKAPSLPGFTETFTDAGANSSSPPPGGKPGQGASSDDGGAGGGTGGGKPPATTHHAGTTHSSGSGSSGASTGHAAPPPKPSGPVKVHGQVTCSSGKSVEGVWVEAAKGKGFSPWKGLGNGSTSDYWYTLPTSESYSLHVGCGGTTSSWAVSTQTPTVGGTDNSFYCIDVAGQSGYGTCYRR